MIDKVIDWLGVGILLSISVYFFLESIRILSILWTAANKSIFETLSVLMKLYIPLLFPVFVALFLVSLFKILGR